MTSRILEILSISLGTLFAVLSLALGTFDPLWIQLGVGPEIRGGLTTAVSLFVLLMGFLFAIYIKAQAQEDVLGKALSDLKFQIPQISAFKVIDANNALLYLKCQLPLIKSIVNTRIASDGNAEYHTSEGKSYNDAIEKAIKDGMQFREIVNTPWKNSAATRAEALKPSRSKVNGAYEYQVLNTTLPSFLNFCVVSYSDGRKEVLFGWAITKGRRFEQKCFISDEKSVVEFFDAWFSDLYLASESP